MSIPYNDGHSDAPWANAPPMVMLTVSDVERLAKAGVKIEFEQIKSQVRPDPPSEDRDKWMRLPLVEAFWERWRRANPPNHQTFNEVGPWGIYASVFDDTVYVFVSPTDGPPFIIEDQKHLYPSDSLMAALHLREKTK